MKITLKNQIGQTKQVKVGFSWTTFFFGCFVPVCRGDWKYAIITLIAALITGGISWLVFPFFYNKLYINDLLGAGWLPVDELSRSILIQRGFGDFNTSN